MSLITVVVVLIVVGVLLWLVNNKLPMDGTIKTILNAVVVIAVVLWLLNIFGVLGSLNIPINPHGKNRGVGCSAVNVGR